MYNFAATLINDEMRRLRDGRTLRRRRKKAENGRLFTRPAAVQGSEGGGASCMRTRGWIWFLRGGNARHVRARRAGGQERKERTEEENPFSHAHLRHLLDPPAVPIEISNGMPPLTDLIKSNFLVR